MGPADMAEKSIHAGHRGRLKEEFLAHGFKGWPDHKVLELALFYAIPQGDVNDLAHELIERFGSLPGVFDASIDDLCRIKGVSRHTATYLRMLPALIGRYLDRRAPAKVVVNSQQDAMEILRPYFFGCRNELVYILCLDSSGKILGVRQIAEGSIDAADVNLRRIAEESLSLRATRIYLAHNHITNLPLPSGDDWRVTDVVRSALAPFQIELVDHFVFRDGEMVSLKDSEDSRRRNYFLLSAKNGY